MRGARLRCWKPHVASGAAFAEDNAEGLRYIIADLSPAELTGMRRSQTVFEELLKREGILHEFRHEAAEGLAKINGTDANIELLTAIARLDQSDAASAQSVLADLTHIFLHGDGSNVHGEGPQVDFSNTATSWMNWPPVRDARIPARSPLPR